MRSVRRRIQSQQRGALDFEQLVATASFRLQHPEGITVAETRTSSEDDFNFMLRKLPNDSGVTYRVLAHLPALGDLHLAALTKIKDPVAFFSFSPLGYSMVQLRDSVVSPVLLAEQKFDNSTGGFWGPPLQYPDHQETGEEQFSRRLAWENGVESYIYAELVRRLRRAVLELLKRRAEARSSLLTASALPEEVLDDVLAQYINYRREIRRHSGPKRKGLILAY